MTATSAYQPVADDKIRAAWMEHFGERNRAAYAFEALLLAYREPHRRYHTIEHALEVALAARSLSDELTDPDAASVCLAAWSHDAFYQPRGSDNETRSAELAARLATQLGFNSAQIAAVRDLILVSTHRVTPKNRLEMIMCDADLSGLAKPWQGYLDDVENIRVEHKVTSIEQWHAGRRMIIGFFESKEPLFYLDESASRWDAAARANFAKEKAQLPAPSQTEP